MEKIKVDYTHDNAVARITLDDGKGNVLDNIMMSELIELLTSYKDNPNLKLITFEGAGNNFSYGASVEEHTKERAGEMLLEQCTRRASRGAALAETVAPDLVVGESTGPARRD